MATTKVSPRLEPNTRAPDGDYTPSNKTANNESIRSTHRVQTKHVPTLIPVMPETPKDYREVLAYEDKWIGWDGPVWCKRYGRFEEADDAAKDDGFRSSGQVHHQDLGSHHKHSKDCICREPLAHHSYVEDIKRRIEPMVASLVSLEHQVANVVHHLGVNKHTQIDGKLVKGTGVMDSHHHEANERYGMHDDGLSQVTNRAPSHKSEALVKLEAEIHTLQHKVHELIKNDEAAVKFVQQT